jgi:hypothetical protein
MAVFLNCVDSHLGHASLTSMAAVGLPQRDGVMVFLTNSSTESERKHYLCSTTPLRPPHHLTPHSLSRAESGPRAWPEAARTKLAKITWLIVSFGDKGRYPAWPLGTTRSTRHYDEASSGHKRWTVRVTTASTVSSGPTWMTALASCTAARRTRSFTQGRRAR